jgi:hypothetical protein
MHRSFLLLLSCARSLLHLLSEEIKMSGHCLNFCCWVRKTVVARGDVGVGGGVAGEGSMVVVSLSGGGSGVDMVQWMALAGEAVVRASSCNSMCVALGCCDTDLIVYNVRSNSISR